MFTTICRCSIFVVRVHSVRFFKIKLKIICTRAYIFDFVVCMKNCKVHLREKEEPMHNCYVYLVLNVN